MKQIFSQYSGMKREIYILFLGRLVTAMGSFVWPLMTFFLTARLGLSDALAALVVASATILSLPAVMLGGKMADRFNRKNIILLLDLVTVSLYILSAVLPVRKWTAVLIFIAALSQNMEHPAYGALTADFSTSAQREKAYSISYLGFNLGYIVGASVAGMLFQNYLKLAFVLNGLAIFTSTALIFFFVDMEHAVAVSQEQTVAYSVYEQPVEQDRPIWQVLRSNPVVFRVMLASCFSYLPSLVVGVLLPLQLKHAMGGAGAAIYGYLNSLNGLIVIVFTPILSVLLKRFSEIPKMALGMALFGAGMALFSNYSIAVLFLAMTVFSLGEVTSVLGDRPYCSRRIPSSHRGRITGTKNLMGDVFSGVGQLAISGILLLTGSRYAIIWMLFASCGGVIAVILACLYPADRRTYGLLWEQ